MEATRSVRGGTDIPPTQASLDDRLVLVPDDVPALDASKHSVPLEAVYFDTFQTINRAVPLTEANSELIESLRDAIPPIHEPIYEQGRDATWLRDLDMVLGYAVNGGAWAYPLRILNFHEIVNDHLDGEPVLISYCPLCYSGVVYMRALGEQVLTFGNTSALYESDMVMLDYNTGSYWWQVAGRAIVGPLTDERLTVLPSMTTTWGNWRLLYPESLVLSQETGFDRNYSRDPFLGIADSINRGNFAFPVSAAALDERLLPGERVLVVGLEEEVRAYPVESLANGVFSDSLGGQELVVFVQNGAGAAYLLRVEGQSLSFVAVDNGFRDEHSGTMWDFAGRALEGDLAGLQLERLPSKTTFWFAIVAAEPEITIHSE